MADIFQTYQAIGNQEDLIDLITNISPVDTYVFSTLAKTRATARYHEWQTDSLRAAAENIVVEGADATNVAVVPTARTGNHCQILRTTWNVSDTQESTMHAGRGSEMAYQGAKSMKELAKDIEYALVVNAASASGASGTARKSLGIVGWIATNNTTGTGTGNETLTEAMYNDNLELCWQQGGRPTVSLVTAGHKRVIDGFTTNTRFVSASDQTLVAAVDVYKSSFGPMTIRLHQEVNTSLTTTLLNLQMDLWRVAFLRPLKPKDLPDLGGGPRKMLEAELTLESLQEKGSGKITQLSGG